ncbi:MAG TPA: beta-glucosidase BglX [Chitinophagaceae bacterium]|nr:beta-glucosidase BglX [Chitinophagaceae bacterium]
MQTKSIVFVFLIFLFPLWGRAQTGGSGPMDRYVTSLMKKMTLDEKIGQLNLPTGGSFTVTGPKPSLDVEDKIRKGEVGGVFSIYTPEAIQKEQDIAVKESRLHIPLIIGLDVIHGHRTIFPIPLGMSCTWDTSLIRHAARIAATEASADGVDWVFSPMVDIARDPRWGRVAEGSGEDPWLGSLIAAAVVRGYQGNSLEDTNTVMACVKHFALYGAVEGGREYNSVDMSPLKMYQSYLPPYRAAVDAGVGSVMTSFNDVDGLPSTANPWLLTDLLRKQWGFRGFVVSDYTSVSELSNHGLGDLQTVSAIALKAGTDMDMVSEGFLKTLKKSIQEGKVSMADLDRACRLVLEAKYKLGLFKDPYLRINEQRARSSLLTPANLDTAKKVAEHSFVLLKNESQTLPLSRSATIALVGPLADDQTDLMGSWVLAGDPRQVVTIRKGLEQTAVDPTRILYAPGSDFTDDPFMLNKMIRYHLLPPAPLRHPDSAQMVRDALQAAAKADVIVAALGESANMSGEAASRSDIGIPACQEALLHALVATGKPVVLVLINGRPLTLPWEENHCAAILETWAGGTEAGAAIADVLYGDYNPSGKLTMSFPQSVGQIPVYYNHKNTGRPYDPNNRYTSQYLDISNDPLYPFGFGLSYTTFSYSAPSLDRTELTGDQKAVATVTVTNTGKYAGQETVQLYISQPVATLTRAVEDLRGFRKIFLQPGQSTQVHFTITPEDLKYYHLNLDYGWDPGTFIIRTGPNSRDLQSVSLVWKKGPR